MPGTATYTNGAAAIFPHGDGGCAVIVIIGYKSRTGGSAANVGGTPQRDYSLTFGPKERSPASPRPGTI